MMKRWGILLLVVEVALAVIWLMKDQSNDQLFEVMKVPEFQLTNQNNQTITAQDMLGKVYVVEFFFTNCPTICPIMKQNLIEVDNELNNPNFGVISITIDPKRDTPETLRIHQN